MLDVLADQSGEGKKGLPIRLAQVVYALELGGSEVLAWRIAKVLNQGRGHICSIYSVQGGGTLTGVLAADGIPAKAFFRKGRLDLRLILQLAKQFRSEKVQLVHTHHLGQLLYGGLAGRLAKARVIHTEHEYYTLGPLHLRRLLRVLSVFTDAVTSVAEPVTEFLCHQVGIPAEKLKTIPNGVDVTCFSTAKPIDREVLGWQDKDIIIGCIARMEKEKGHVILLEAFRQVHARHPCAKLLLIGEGTERRRLEEMSVQLNLKGSVLFTGARADVPEFLSACDIMALASVHEGLPIAILEAMAARKPVVATEVGSVPQIVLDGETGLLVQPRDAWSLAQALEALITDRTKRRRLGSHGFDRVRAHHSFDQTVTQYTALYDSALQGRKYGGAKENSRS